MTRHFLSQADLTAEEMRLVFERTAVMKPVRFSNDLAGRSLVMFFEKSSTRTRLSFEVGMTQMGGHAIYLDRESSQFSRGESLADMAQVVSRYADLMMARVYAHSTVEELAKYSSIPVLNGLSDDEHPCQTMADFFTIVECRGQLAGLKLAFVGDGANNVTHSLLIGAAQLGINMAVGSPTELRPDKRFVELAQEKARTTGAQVIVTENAAEAVREADVVYTDVWVSMGRVTDKERRLELLHPYQVNAELISYAKPDFIFMHCLPAHIGEEVTSDVAYGPNSVIFDQAENRLHVQKALMLFLLEAAARSANQTGLPRRNRAVDQMSEQV
jgi:ornithine carbamoyltransferase